jgi:glycosyltransferase involved in cell wall biosynthesis
MELVSIYLPTKNRLPLLRRAVDSVLRQDYANIELLIVDDGSTDGTCEYLLRRSKEDDRISLYSNPGIGACSARNFAIANSRGKFVTGIDDDDYFSSALRITEFVNAWGRCQHLGPVAIFDSVTVLCKNGTRTIRNTAERAYAEDLLMSNLIGSQVFAERSIYFEAGLFNPAQPAWQDWDLWIRMALNGVHFINMKCNSYVVDESHEFLRISLKPETQIRMACVLMQATASAHCKLKISHRAGMTASMLAYPSVRLRFKDACVLIAGLKLRSLIRKIWASVERRSPDIGALPWRP